MSKMFFELAQKHMQLFQRSRCLVRLVYQLITHMNFVVLDIFTIETQRCTRTEIPQ
jgi:hypothetical protein